MRKSKKIIIILAAVLLLGSGAKSARAQESSSVLYVPLIGISAVPEPLALPKGPGDVTYNYAVKNFIAEVPLVDIQVTDDKCGPIKFTEGDDDNDAQLDYNETWRYACNTRLEATTQSVATATGRVNDITATHKAYATVVVGSNNPAPLVSIVNITKVAYPLALPAEGGDIAFTYRVNNPGVVPLSDVTVRDDKCSAISSKLGDTNGNNLLDINEVWIYSCSTHLTQTTTNTVSVTAFANGFQAVGDATITVKVENPNLPDVGEIPAVKSNFKTAAWAVLAGILAVLVIFFALTRKSKLKNKRQ